MDVCCEPDFVFSKGSQLVADAAQKPSLRQPVPGWQAVHENLGSIELTFFIEMLCFGCVAKPVLVTHQRPTAPGVPRQFPTRVPLQVCLFQKVDPKSINIQNCLQAYFSMLQAILVEP